MRNDRNNRDCLHKKTPVEMCGPGTSKHCVTNMVADDGAVIAAVITAIFLVNKEEKENREIVYNREIAYKGEETHASNHGLCRRYCSSISTTCLQRELSPVPKYI